MKVQVEFHIIAKRPQKDSFCEENFAQESSHENCLFIHFISEFHDEKLFLPIHLEMAKEPLEATTKLREQKAQISFHIKIPFVFISYCCLGESLVSLICEKCKQKLMKDELRVYCTDSRIMESACR